jgi:SAM-dependent methyltransferase
MSKIDAKLHWNNVYRTTNYSKTVTDRSATVLGAATDFFGDLRGKRLLEIGCGGGAASLHFARLGAEVVAVDISDTAVEHLKGEMQRQGLTTVSPQVCDAMNISSLGQFDAVFGSMILHHIEPFSQFAGILFQTLTPGGKAFFWENNAHSRLLVWCRENLVGRFGIPKHGDNDEFPLTPDELDELKARFQVRVEYPELFLFRMISIYLLRGHARKAFDAIDEYFYSKNMFLKYSYRQYLMLTK